MAQYEVRVQDSAQKELLRLPRQIAARMINALRLLETTPRSANSRKLYRSDDSYRIRVGDYRIVYRIDDNAKLVTVYRIGHRGEVYRR